MTPLLLEPEVIDLGETATDEASHLSTTDEGHPTADEPAVEPEHHPTQPAAPVR